jgi:predicted transcriptional regulator
MTPNELQEWKKLHDYHRGFGSYSTKDLAIFLEVSTRTIQRWLKGTAEPTLEQLARIKVYLAGQKEIKEIS